MSDAIPVPPRPSLEQYKKRAKGLVHACNADDRHAIRAWAAGWMESLLGAPGDVISTDRRAWVDRQANRIEALARAKVTGAAQAAACTLTDAQFVAARAHGFESWPLREAHRGAVARAAQRSLQVARERLAAGDALLVFAEGTRSRTREMQPLLPAVARYFEGNGVRILPASIVGTEALFPVGSETLNPVRIVVRIGQPIDAEALRARAGSDRRLAIDTIGLAVADLLPSEYRGAYGTSQDAARRVLADLEWAAG